MLDESKFIEVLSRINWFFMCAITLGFPSKYHERLCILESLVPASSAIPWSTPPQYSHRGTVDTEDPQKMMRQQLQEEWDKLGTVVSVITATSAAALAIQASDSSFGDYRLSTPLYSAAFGISLLALILITYMSFIAGVLSDEAIGRLARGELLRDRLGLSTGRLIAFIMALPATLTIYSSISLFVGLVCMLLNVSDLEGMIEGDRRIFNLVAMIPIVLTLLLVLIAFVGCELGVAIEKRGRRKYLKEHGQYLRREPKQPEARAGPSRSGTAV